jgi:hypothetical protein
MYVPTGQDLSGFNPRARMVAHSLTHRCASGSLVLILYISTEALEATVASLGVPGFWIPYALQLEQNI